MTKLEFGDLVAKMPDGFAGFLKTWGLSQFADLIEVEVRKNVIADMQLTNEQAMVLYEKIAPLFYENSEVGRADTIRAVVKIIEERENG